MVIVLKEFLSKCMEHEHRLKDLSTLIEYIDSLDWQEVSNLGVSWKTVAKAPFFYLSLEVFIFLTPSRGTGRTLERDGTIDGCDVCSLKVWFYCSNSDNPLYKRYIEKFGVRKELPLTTKQDFIEAHDHMKFISEFFHSPSV